MAKAAPEDWGPVLPPLMSSDVGSLIQASIPCSMDCLEMTADQSHQSSRHRDGDDVNIQQMCELGQGCGSVVQCLLNMCKALGLTHRVLKSVCVYVHIF